MLGLACTAAPILVNGMAVGAVSISVPGRAVGDARADAALRATAVHIARDIRGRLAEGHSHWFPKDF